MKILVTGGAGYIGSHTVKELIREGYEVITFDNFSTGFRDLVIGGEIISGDLTNQDVINNTFTRFEIGAVLHFASLAQVEDSYTNPGKYYNANLISSLNLLQAMLDNGVQNIIFSSSAAVYGLPESTPISEAHPLRPISPYGQTKFIIETILNDYARAYDLNYISLRYFNAAGADPEKEIGEKHEPETHLIPNILCSLQEEKEEFSIFGKKFPTPDGTAIRDYIHVTDLAAAHVLALEKLATDPVSEVFNLGSSQGFSVLEIIQAVEDVTGHKVPRSYKPARKGDPPILLASNQKARRVLGWQPQYSDIDTIIQTAWAWHSRV